MANKSGIVPVEYKVLVLPEQVSEFHDASGLIKKTDTDHETEELAQTEGVMVEISDMAFTDWKCRRPEVGERVKFARYAGLMVEGKDGLTYRVIKDQDVVAILGD